MARPNVLRIVCILFCLTCLGARVAEAQYLYLDSNGDGVHSAADVVNPTGPTTIDVWIDTDSNRDGSPAVCSSGDGDLTINSYEIILRATNGTISWGAFTNLQPDFTTSFGQASSATELYAGFGGGTILPPGLYHLATLPASITSGTPSIAVVTATPLGAVYLTSFGSRCSGNDFDNTLKLGSDWSDADGLPYGGTPNEPPTLTQPQDMETPAGSVTHQTLHASDPDGQPLEFLKVSGPHYLAVTTVDPGSGIAMGDVALTPQQSDIGSAMGTVAASDGLSSDQKTFSITVTFGCGEGVCFEQRTLSSSGIPINVVAGDVNGDLDLDLVTVYPRSYEIRMGRGDGTFAVPTVLPVVASPGRIWDTEVADMNGDGLSDLVATSDPTQVLDLYYTIHIFLSRGDGTFQAMPTYQRDPSTLDHFGPTVVVGDLNGDARMDLVVPRSGGKVSVFLGNGDGTVGPVVDWTVGFFTAHSAGLADVNGDGNQDIVSVGGSGLFSLLLGRGDGTFETQPIRSGPVNAGFLAAGDLDQDGREDFALNGSSSPLPFEMAARIFRGASDGTPVPASPLHTASFGPSASSFEDMTGDGIADAVVTTYGFEGGSGSSLPYRDAYLSVHVGDGTGAFGDRTDIPAPTEFGWNGMATGDWDSDGRTDVVVVYSPSNLVRLLLNRGYRPHSDRPVSLYGVTQINLTEGLTSIQSFVADDPDGDPVTLTLDRSGLPAEILTEPRATAVPWQLGVALTAGFGTAGDYGLTIRASANGTTASWPVEVHVVTGNRAPLADAGGPYDGVVGVPVEFDGSGSSDPDGQPLLYRWSFGDSWFGSGAVASHTYSAMGTYPIELLVRDQGNPPRFATDNTTATIAAWLPAEGTLVGTSRTIPLVGPSRPSTCFQIEASEGAFTPDEIDPGTIRMKYTGAEIAAIADRTVVGGDQDKDGIPELTACFRREDMRQLLSSVTGRDTVEVALEGRLTSGALFRASLDLIVVAGGGTLSAALSPNPLNPRATLSFVTPREGTVRADLFDVSGRRVRTLIPEARRPAGYHEVTIEAQGPDNGLSSGIYFFRIEADGTVATGRFAVLK